MFILVFKGIKTPSKVSVGINIGIIFLQQYQQKLETLTID
tara:strand:+ start:1167 stop:1286 length:120 start_codon:yes stop_codon:yes gene_type:complete